MIELSFFEMMFLICVMVLIGFAWGVGWFACEILREYKVSLKKQKTKSVK